MFSGTLLQLFTVTIIFTEQIETRCLNKTHKLENPECTVNNTSASKRSAKPNERDKHDILRIMRNDYDQRSDTKLETKYDILARCKYNLKSNQIEKVEIGSDKAEEECDEHIKLKTTIMPAKNELTSFYDRNAFSNEEDRGHNLQVSSNNKIQKADFKKVKQDIETKQELNDDSSLQNNEKQDKPFIPKAMSRWTTEVYNEICKIKHCDQRNDRSAEIISRENVIYRLKYSDEITSASEHSNELNQRYSKRHRTFKRKLLTGNESSKQSDLSHAISKENENYNLENRVDIPSAEIPVTKKVKPKYKPKLDHNILNKKHKKKIVEKVIDKTKSKSKIKHDNDKVESNNDKKKPTRNGNNEKKPDVNSEDSLNFGEADAQTSSDDNQDEKEILTSSEESVNQNDLVKNPRLPFYVTSPTLTKGEIAKKYKKKTLPRKGENDAEIIMNDVEDKNIDINRLIDQLASTKILDFITDKVADKMLKKLQNNQAFKSDNITAIDAEPEKVEQIDIVFKNDGDMVMTNRAKEKEILIT